MSGSERSPAPELPIACTLGANDGATRMQRWRSLSATGRPSVRRDGNRVVVSYQAAPGVREELEVLAAAERQCCAFAAWEVTEEADHVILRVAADAEGIEAIVGLFTAMETAACRTRGSSGDGAFGSAAGSAPNGGRPGGA